VTIIRKEKIRKEKGVREEKKDVSLVPTLDLGRNGGRGGICELGFMCKSTLS
jgi:hypothetical protein